MDYATVSSRFKQIAARHGDRPAIMDRDTLSYRELQARADRFSDHVASVDRGRAPVVGISLENTPEAIAAMLGVLQAGRAFTFIDSRAPVDSKLAVVREMQLGLVVGQGKPWDKFDGQWIDSDSSPRGRPTEVTAPPEAPCCIIQTSGSTGQPLGVEISHQAMLHTIDNYAAMAQLGPEDRFTLLTSGAHFAAQSAIFGSLLNGACLCPFDVRRDGFSALADWLERVAITIYQSPPSLFRAFVRQISVEKRFPALRLVRLGGEPMLTSDFELFQEHFPPSVICINAYGITEAAGNVAYLRLDRAVRYPGAVLPVGIPAKEREILLLDGDGQPADSGEIVVRSPFLATGYYQRPGLDELKFRVGPDGKSRELWTGDLGHRTAEGWLMHDGRKDHQVKIRGQRVDLAGLEAIVRALPGVRDARVLFDSAAEQVLVFVVSALPIQLPSLAVLPRVIHVPAIPLTPGGKVDQGRLLEYRNHSGSSPPRDENERIIAEIWHAVLHDTGFGVYDNFFALGGDSLKVLKVCAALEERYRRKFSPSLFLDRPTVAQLGEYIASGRQKRSLWRGVFGRRESECVVTLYTPASAAQAPLFICPGGWAHERELLPYAALLPHLPPDLPLYGLKQTFLRKAVKVAGSAETIATTFAREIRRIQPTGPYRLLGECVASVIVLELAHQLRASGDVVERIILLDPRTPRSQTIETITASKAITEKVRAYYQVLSKAKPPPCPQSVDVISTEDEATVRRRLEHWGAFGPAPLRFTRLPGDHLTFLREHRIEVADAIARLTSSPFLG